MEPGSAREHMLEPVTNKTKKKLLLSVTLPPGETSPFQLIIRLPWRPIMASDRVAEAAKVIKLAVVENRGQMEIMQLASKLLG